MKFLRIVAGRWAVYLLMVAGLGLSYAAVIVVALYVHDELTYDRFMPGADQVYFLSASYGPQDQPLVNSDRTPAGMARWMKSDLPEVDRIARLSSVEWPMRSARRQARERFYWADADIFGILQLPALHGDLKTALAQPDTVVMTRRMALSYFGRDDAVGQVLTTKDNVPLRVTAVLQDLPANSHLDREIFVSGKGSYTMLSVFDYVPDYLWPNTYIYVTFKPGTSVPAVEARLQGISRAHWRGPNNIPEGYRLIRLPDLHFQPHGDGEMKPRGHVDSILALVAVSVAILALAGINFSGLVLAESQDRGAEMAIRTALGARRANLIAHVLREAFCVNLVSLLLALAGIERFLPTINAALDLELELWRDPAVFLSVLAAVAGSVTLLSGIFPAIIISRPYTGRPAGPARLRPATSGRWRGWVVTQIALVIVLLIASHTLNRQWRFATDEALNFNGDNVMMIRLAESPEANAAFRHNVASIKGVTAVAESFGTPTTDNVRPAWIRRPGQPLISLTRNSTHPDFFKVFQVPLVAGRPLEGTFLVPETPRDILVNQAAVTALGFATPAQALGQEIEYETDRTRMRSRIIGVVPDMRLSTLYLPTEPMIFDNFSKYFTQLNVRLDGEDVPGTVARIDAQWRRDNGGDMLIERRFFKDYLLQQYHDLYQQMQVFNLVAGVAIILSMLGLTGLSIFLTRHQIQEMAIRTALGATFSDLLVQRLIPFFVPLLVANLIAWPVAWLALRGWLNAFADHVALSMVSFAGAGAICVAFALITVTAYSAFSAHGMSGSVVRRG